METLLLNCDMGVSFGVCKVMLSTEDRPRCTYTTAPDAPASGHCLSTDGSFVGSIQLRLITVG
jgi:hypothetical protein